ncbi:DUF4097 family beta strand repeat-containing protein [Nonomuraea sp. NPDC050556]|uniref:DUF4097 family beta strand repeat-containing protein n=1 Tax=Nonomuraea sp. NPDC050556 TaxID=3364369 RepID=UPI0037A08B70
MPTFDTPEPIVATLDLGYGRVTINAGERADTVVSVRPTDGTNDTDIRAAAETRIDYANGRLSVRVPKSTGMRWLFGWGASVDVTVDLPAGSRISADASAEIRCRGRVGEARLHTAMGDIQIEEAGRLRLSTGDGDITVGSAGPSEVTTANGTIRLGSVDGAAVVKTSNGSIEIASVSGDVRINTASGDIDVHRALAGVGAKTAHGSVRVGEVARGAVVLETASGEVEVGVRVGSAAWLDVDSSYGTVLVALDAAEGPGESDEAVEVRARTHYGNIRIHRSHPPTAT